MIHIDKGLPIPPKYDRNEIRSLMEAMEVGDSFFIPLRDTTDGGRSRIYVEAHAARIKVLLRQITENDMLGLRMLGLRVWRIT